MRLPVFRWCARKLILSVTPYGVEHIGLGEATNLTAELILSVTPYGVEHIEESRKDVPFN